MNLLLWIILGALAGWLASSITGRGRQNITTDIILGILGALIGGFILSLFGVTNITGFSFTSLIVAVIGAVILIWIGRSFRQV